MAYCPAKCCWSPTKNEALEKHDVALFLFRTIRAIDANKAQTAYLKAQITHLSA